MSSPCFNPDCDRMMAVAGVCFACANSSYKPSEDGMDLGSIVVEGTKA